MLHKLLFLQFIPIQFLALRNQFFSFVNVLVKGRFVLERYVFIIVYEIRWIQ